MTDINDELEKIFVRRFGVSYSPAVDDVLSFIKADREKAVREAVEVTYNKLIDLFANPPKSIDFHPEDVRWSAPELVEIMKDLKKGRNKVKKFEIVKANAYELDPSKVYLICIDRASASVDDVQQLVEKLKIANGSVALMTNGDPNTAVKVIEAPTK